jgi:energy-coupling factor transporter transmembrane protein EcfT
VGQHAIGDTGRLLAFAFTIGLSAIAVEWRSLAVLILAIMLGMLLSRQSIDRLVRDRTLIPLAVIAIGVGSMMGQRDLTVGPIALSSSGLSFGVQIMVRALAILLAVHTLTSALSLSSIAAFFERFGFKGLGFALGVAVNSLPMIQDNFRDSLVSLRLRGGFRRNRLRSVYLLLLTTLTNTIRQAEDIVAAAEARAFRVESNYTSRLSRKPADIILLIGLIGVSVLILAL